jgi:hypothetical protein
MVAVMKSKSTPLDALKRAWRRWTDTVAMFASRHPARLKLSAQEYQKLREELITLCDSLANSTDDRRREAYYRELEGLVRPFLTPRALSQTDYEILLDVLARCQRIERELTNRSWSLRGLARILLPAMLGATAFGLVFVLIEVGNVAEWAPIAWLRGWFVFFRLMVRRRSDLEKVVAAAVLVSLAAIYLARRVTRV